MKAMIKELSGPEMMAVTGGKTNNNPNPGSMTSPIDQIVNGKNYDAIAQMIADWQHAFPESEKRRGHLRHGYLKCQKGAENDERQTY